MKEKGRLFVISGPSGAGKSTVVFKAIEGRDDVCFSTSVTTRKPRPNEVDGREYFFVDLDRFKEMVENDELLEHATYVANSYGTPRKFVEDKLDSGLDVLLDIEVQGAAKVRQRCPDAIFIFIIPPSFEELSRRLHRRNTDSEEVIQGRLEKAKVEFQQVQNYDYLVINDKVANAVAEIESILVAAECQVKNRKQILTQFS